MERPKVDPHDDRRVRRRLHRGHHRDEKGGRARVQRRRTVEKEGFAPFCSSRVTREPSPAPAPPPTSRRKPRGPAASYTPGTPPRAYPRRPYPSTSCGTRAGTTAS
eukprot:30960-Pelagococcus_subviridis.AAC.3